MDLLAAIAHAIQGPQQHELCFQCGFIGPPGTHEAYDAHGNVGPACDGWDIERRYQVGLAQFEGLEPEQQGRRRARGYAVR